MFTSPVRLRALCWLLIWQTASPAVPAARPGERQMPRTRASSRTEARGHISPAPKTIPKRPLLNASNPADPADPYVASQAAALGEDPNRIFAFVRDQIRFEAYSGSVRGARGALWSKGANALDRASLLIALLGAAGVSARYVQGQLDNPTLAKEIGSSYPTPARAMGCVPRAVAGYDPRSDGFLYRDTYTHFWVEYGPGNTPMDANFPNAAIGTTFAAAVTRFTVIPPELRQQVTLRLKAELYGVAGSLFNLGPDTTTVLTQTFDTADLVGKPITVGNFVHASAAGALDISATTFTYTPYLLIGQGDGDVASNPIVTGQDFQELYTNFPLASTVLTGLFLEIDAATVNSYVQTYTRTIYDRIGYAARQGVGASSLSVSGPPAAALTDFDITTVNILPGLQGTASFSSQQARLNKVVTQYKDVQTQVAAIPSTGPAGPADAAVLQNATNLSRYILIAQNELITMGYNGAADAFLEQLQKGYDTHAYYITPRLTVAAVRDVNGAAAFRLDVLKNEMRVAPDIGQSQNAAYDFEVARGLVETALEGKVLAQVTGQTAISIDDIFEALPSIDALTVITGQNVETLGDLSLSADATARINTALANGKTVFTPTRMVTLNGLTTVAWYETDASGHTTSVFEDGGHQAIADYAVTLDFVQKFNANTIRFIGNVEGFGVTGIAFAAGVLNGAASNSSYTALLKGAKGGVSGQGIGQGQAIYKQVQDAFKKLNQLVNIKLPPGVSKGFGLINSFASGLKEGLSNAQKFLKWILPVDPPVFPFVVQPLGPAPASIPPAGSAGVNLSVVTDPLFTYSYGSLDLPLVFVANVQNTGPAADIFNITIPSGLQNYYVYPSVNVIQVGAGQTGQVGVCVVPNDNSGNGFPAVGSAQNFTVSATSATNPAITAMVPSNFNQPALPVTQLTAAPATLSTTAGVPVTTVLGLTGLGNADAGSVTLSVVAPAAVTVTGLTSQVTVTQGKSNTQALTITPPVSARPGDSYNVEVDATYGSAGLTQTATLNIPVTIAGAGGCALKAFANANKLGKTSMAQTLSDLNIAMNGALANSSDGAGAARVVGDLNSLIAQIDRGVLLSQVATLKADSSAVAAATPVSLPAVIAMLNGDLCNLNTVLAAAVSFNTSIALNPTQLTVLPQSPAVFPVSMQNGDVYTHVYDLSVSGLPAGVQAAFSQPTVTLGPGAFVGNLTLTLTPSANFSGTANFTVSATPEDSPANARTATGLLALRTEIVSIDSVTATPPFGDAGTPIAISARIFAAVNVNRSFDFTGTVYNAAGQQVANVSAAAQVTLTTSAGLVTASLNPIDTTHFAPGVYTVKLTASNFTGGVIPNPLGTGSFLIGTPVSASLTATPAVLIPPAATTKVTFNIAHDSLPNPLSTLLGTIPTTSAPHTVSLNGNLAYVCNAATVDIFDIGDPMNPVLKATFGQTELTSVGYSNTSCAIYNNNLILEYSRPSGNISTAVQPTFLTVYSLANPLSPVAGNTVQFQHSDTGGVQVAGSTAYTIGNEYFYNPYSNFIFQQFGDFVSFDLTDLTDITLKGDLFPPPAGDPNRGGPNRVFSAIPLNPQTTLLTSSTSTSGDTQTGFGNLLVVDTTNPAVMSVTTSVHVPGTVYLNGIARQGNTVVVTGDSAGLYDARSGFVGNLVLASFDITNPRAPVLLNTLTTQLTDKDGSNIVSLGNNTYAVGGTLSGGKPVLLLVDASNPSSLRYIPYDAAFASNPAVATGNTFYTLSSNGLSIYRLSTLAGPQLTASLQIPKGTGVTVDPASFSLTPTSVTAGSTFDTYTWQQPSGPAITFNAAVTGLVAGDVRPVVLGGTVNFTAPSLGSATLPVGPLNVLTAQILDISPALQQVNGPGQPATYMVTVKNPTSAAITYNLSVLGIPSSWVSIQPTVMVAGQGSQAVPLVLTLPGDTATLGNGSDYGFTVTASAAGTGGISGSVLADVFASRYGDFGNVGGNNPNLTYNFTASLSTSQITAGQATQAQFTVTLKNAGTGTVSVYPSFPGITPGYGAYPTINVANLAGGIGNTLTFGVTIVVPAGALPGAHPFTLSLTGQQSSVSLPFVVNVAPNGVAVGISPNPAAPTDPLQLRVTNLGTVQDTFDLSIPGALATAATLATTQLTLAPRESQTVAIVLAPLKYIGPGSIPLQALAVSRGNTAVRALATATVNNTAVTGVATTLTPNTSTLANAPGSVAMSLTASGTGNIDDVYTAKITKVTGPVTAALLSAGQAVQSIARIAIPGGGIAQVPVTATLTANGTGTVTVAVTSTTNPAVTSTSTATISSGPPTMAPAASAGANRTVPLNRLAFLDASGSVDTNAPRLPLTFAWTLVSAPQGSKVNTGTIHLPTAVRAAFIPDFTGDYVFQSAVANGAASAMASVTVHAQPFPPVAIALGPQNVPTGQLAILSGRDSYDPDGGQITYAWDFAAVPATSTLTPAAIFNASTPRPFFTPDVAGMYRARLVVNNGTQASAPSIVTITAGAGPLRPNADAGGEKNTAVLAAVTLDGSNTSDPNSPALSLTYEWSLTQAPVGSALTTTSISSAGAAKAQFTPDVAGDYTFNLRVTNSVGSSDAATVIHATFGFVAPNAVAAQDQYVLLPATGNLSGGGSADPDSGPLALSYNWFFVSTPTGSSALLATPSAVTTQLQPDKTGFYNVRLEASDGVDSGFANALVTATMVCDADANGIVNMTDLGLITAAIGQMAQANDPRDFNGDGSITQADVTGCAAKIPVAPAITISPAALMFSASAGSAVQSQTVSIAATTAVNFSAAGNQPWIALSPASGSTASVTALIVSVNPAGLMPGTYSGIVTLTPSAGAVQTVAVNLTIAPPTFTVSPGTLSFTAGSGPQTIALTANPPVNFTVMASQPWISVSPSSSSTATAAMLTVSVNATGFDPGTYTGAVTITPAAGAPQTVQISVVVAGMQPPAGPPAVPQVLANPSSLSAITTQNGASVTANLTLTASGAQVPFVSSVSANAAWLTVSANSSSTPATLTVTFNPAGLAGGSYSATILVSPDGTDSLAVPVTLQVTGAPPQPSITAVVNAAGMVPGPVAGGSLIAIFGTNLTSITAQANSFPLPATMGGVSIQVAGVSVPLTYVSPTQINAQLPYEATPGKVNLILKTGSTTLPPFEVTVVPVAPGLFLLAGGRAAAENQDYSVNTSDHGSQAGGFLIAYFTGQGSLDNRVATGAAALGSLLSRSVAVTEATIGDRPAVVVFSGMTPGLAGLAQANILVPAMTPGNYPLVLTVGGVRSNAGTVTISGN